MLIFCPGIQRSGSTWAFNVVRALTAITGESWSSVFASDSIDLANKVQDWNQNLIIKMHRVDAPTARIISLTSSPCIMTWRDPRDALVSASNAIASDLPSTFQAIAADCASFVSLLDANPPHLLLIYENDFTATEATIKDIASALKIPASTDEIRSIFNSLTRENILRSIAEWSDDQIDQGTFITQVDLATHWHKDHIGDGKVGKWSEQLPSDWMRFADAAFRGIHEYVCGKTPQLVMRCPPELLEPKNTEAGELIRASLFALPSGNWEMTIPVHTDSDCDALVDVVIESGETVSSRAVRASNARKPIRLRFDVRDTASGIMLVVRGTDVGVGLGEAQLSRLDGTVRSRSDSVRTVTSRVTPENSALQHEELRNARADRETALAFAREWRQALERSESERQAEIERAARIAEAAQAMELDYGNRVALLEARIAQMRAEADEAHTALSEAVTMHAAERTASDRRIDELVNLLKAERDERQNTLSARQAEALLADEQKRRQAAETLLKALEAEGAEREARFAALEASLASTHRALGEATVTRDQALAEYRSLTENSRYLKARRALLRIIGRG